MDLFDRFAGNDSWHTRRLLEYAGTLTAELRRILGDIRNRSAWDDTFVDALCEPAETFTFGGVFAHIMTFNAHRRLMALDVLRQLGVPTEGFGDPMEYEESVAPLEPAGSSQNAMREHPRRFQSPSEALAFWPDLGSKAEVNELF